MSAHGSSNPTGSKGNKTKVDKKEEQNDQADAVMEGIVFEWTIQPRLRDKGKSVDPNSPGKKIVDKQMEQLAAAKKEKKRELQARKRKSQRN